MKIHLKKLKSLVINRRWIAPRESRSNLSNFGHGERARSSRAERTEEYVECASPRALALLSGYRGGSYKIYSRDMLESARGREPSQVLMHTSVREAARALRARCTTFWSVNLRLPRTSRCERDGFTPGLFYRCVRSARHRSPDIFGLPRTRPDRFSQLVPRKHRHVVGRILPTARRPCVIYRYFLN